MNTGMHNIVYGARFDYYLSLCQKNVMIAGKKFYVGSRLKFCGSSPRNI